MRENTSTIGMPTSTDKVAATDAAQALIALCSGVLPVWVRHLAASRAQSETAVSEMMQAFANISPHLHSAQQQSLQITAALSPGDENLVGLAQACENVLAPLRKNAQLPAGGAEAIDAAVGLVRDAVTAIEQINRPFSQETYAVAEQVERMYIGFQYQDRISQMIALLEADIARLQEVVDGRLADTPELQTWLSRLEEQYVMAEQRNSHARDVNAAPGADDELTFF